MQPWAGWSSYTAQSSGDNSPAHRRSLRHVPDDQDGRGRLPTDGRTPITTPGKVYVAAAKQLYLNTLHRKRMCRVVPQQIQKCGSTVFENRGVESGAARILFLGGDVLHKKTALWAL